VVRGSAALAVAGAAAAFSVAAFAGCGGDDEGGSGGTQAPPPVASPEDFPAARGKTLAQLRREVGEEGGPILAPSVSQLEPGSNRFGFGLFDRTRAQIADAPVALYVAPTGGGPARGPFPARYESLAVEPRFASRSVAEDPDAARSLYVADLRFRRWGQYEVLGIVRLDDRLVVATPAVPSEPPAGFTKPAGTALRVMRRSPVPDVGERAPRIHTPTKDDVGRDVERIDTRVPPSTMHEADFADVVGKKPVVLLFATPALCQSRVCGPVVDIAEQVKAETGGDAEFIHMEIYRDNEVELGFRPQVLQWRLPTEPWLFAVDRDGRVAARLEGAFSARELERALKAATARN
jgi:hypothetical protein